MVEIFEDKISQTSSARGTADLMTPEQVKRGDYYQEAYNTRRGEIEKNEQLWNDLWQQYGCDRDEPEQKGDPHNVIPILTPVIEGQTANMVESDVEFNYITSNPGHQPAMKKLNAASKYVRRKNQFMRHIKDLVRKYLLLGNAWIMVAWEDSISNRASQPSGYARVSTPELLDVIVDGKIKDYKDLQYAEYIIHVIGFMPITWAREQYGDEKADALTAMSSNYHGEDPDVSEDDTDSFTLLQIWTRSNEYKNLQLIEMDTNGLILFESDPAEPYYKNVDNEYPFCFVRGMPLQGQFYGFGDGKILMRFQESINCLFDEIEIGAKFSSQGKTYIDPDAEINDDEVNNDPRKYTVANRPSQNIFQTRGVGVSQVLYDMVKLLQDAAQYAVRFSEMMSGIAQGSSATATQINGQLSQGAVGIRDKKSDISYAMAWADRYALRLCLEKWDEPFWADLGDGAREYLDPQSMNAMPAMIPLTTATAAKIENEQLAAGKPLSEVILPEYETVEDENGDTITEALDFDVDVVMSAGIPRGKNDMYNMILGLMQIQVLNPETGLPEPFLETKVARRLMQEALGIKLTDKDEDELAIEGEGELIAGLDTGATNALNPVGNSDVVQTPQGAGVASQAEAMMGNVPGLANTDSRGFM